MKVKTLIEILERMDDEAEAAVMDSEGFQWLGGVIINKGENTVCFVAQDVTIELGPDDYEEVEFIGRFQANPLENDDEEDEDSENLGAPFDPDEERVVATIPKGAAEAKDTGEEKVSGTNNPPKTANP